MAIGQTLAGGDLGVPCGQPLMVVEAAVVVARRREIDHAFQRERQVRESSAAQIISRRDHVVSFGNKIQTFRSLEPFNST